MAINAQASFSNTGALASPRGSAIGETVSPREKAAIIVRLLLSEGASLDLASLPEDLLKAIDQIRWELRDPAV